ncbi:MAG TPA: GxxExxY protein [Opitutaceae bacterium]|nr:GxxExxY protein [Opitutaceae bacterium]HOY54346.1 GxxExxY protein [Opitutaceae bacterium]HPG17630.1 GxxExxY protein [Opitutaceae bacterium]HPN99514.1 GxxExxY protein [Opitutaceae bacterium]HQL22271.1 GxxExxY protein [Opitutaceae bacterium]
MNTDHPHDPLTQRIIGSAFTVYNTLGYGFLEKVYENALVHELRKAGLHITQQKPFPVFYDGINVGDYVADLLVGDSLIIELKSAKAIDDSHIAQCLNYLKAARLRHGLLLNFGPQRVEIRRLIMD